MGSLTAHGEVYVDQEVFSDSSQELADRGSATAKDLILEDDSIHVAFDQNSGALTRLERKSSQWKIQRRPELGVSFRMLVPMPNRRANFIYGLKQHASKVEKVSKNEIRIVWENLLSEHGGRLPISLTATVRLDKGVLQFIAALKNDSNLTVETVDYPYIGDLASPKRDEPMHAEHMSYGDLEGAEIYPRFKNDKGYWGVEYPTKTVESKESLFCLIQAANQGIYVGMHDPNQPYLLEYTFEQHPGALQSIDDVVPVMDEISGIPVHLQFRICHFVFIHPQSTMHLAPVVFHTYDGDWHTGVDTYRQWRSTWFQPRRLPQWVTGVHSWLQLQVDGAEQDFRIPYRDLPAYIDECASNGVEAIQLVGWNRGGQDGGDPSLDTEPGLGTWQELHAAIQHAQEKGVKMILFGKLYWADLTTDWYKTELYKYEATDPFGIPYQTNGYSYTTPTQLAGINNRRRAIMDVQSAAYRDVATREFKKLLDLGATGWLFDEVCHHGPVEYSFSANHGYPPPRFIYGGDMPLAKQFREAADKVDSNFVFAGEGPQDWLMQYYPVSYFRITAGSRPVCRYIDSQAPLVVAVTGFDDREMLNLILLNRYIISYEPFNFKGHVTGFPLTLAYGKKIDELRKKYKEWLWDSEFRDQLGATVTSNGSHRYSVFVARNGRRAVVVVNSDPNKTITVKVKLPNAGRLVMATPEDPDVRTNDGQMQIPGRSAAILLET
jgi:uncharacterized protein DUF6259